MQAIEASCWIPLLRAAKCVLAGDHMQLPPVILSQEYVFACAIVDILAQSFGSNNMTFCVITDGRNQDIDKGAGYAVKTGGGGGGGGGFVPP